MAGSSLLGTAFFVVYVAFFFLLGFGSITSATSNNRHIPLGFDAFLKGSEQKASSFEYGHGPSTPIEEPSGERCLMPAPYTFWMTVVDCYENVGKPSFDTLKTLYTRVQGNTQRTQLEPRICFLMKTLIELLIVPARLELTRDAMAAKSTALDQYKSFLIDAPFDRYGLLMRKASVLFKPEAWPLESNNYALTLLGNSVLAALHAELERA